MDDDCRPLSMARALLHNLAQFQGWQRRRHRLRRFPGALLSCGSGGAGPICFSDRLVEICFARFNRRGSRNAIAHLSSMGAASCSANNNHFWNHGRHPPDYLQTRRQHSAPRRRCRTQIFCGQERQNEMTKIAILGGGSWGTALSIVLSRSHKPHDIPLWMRDPAFAYAVNKTRINELYLPGCPIPAGVAVAPDLADALAHANIIVGAMP